LFSRLTSKKTVTGEDENQETELKYLQVIRNIRDTNVDLFYQIKKLPRKARTAKHGQEKGSSLVTYFRKGRVQKFYLTRKDATKELDFMETAGILAAEKDTPRLIIGGDFYELLGNNKQAFIGSTTEASAEPVLKGGRDSATFILRILKSNQIKHFKGFTEEDEQFIKKVSNLIEEGALPGHTLKTLVSEFQKDAKTGINPLKMLAKLKLKIGPEFFKETVSESAALTAGPREIILSEYIVGK
jgi:hypothetical protein